MRRVSAKLFLWVFTCILFSGLAQAQTATMRVNSAVLYQKITGFGGFVNSPQFGYNHMTTAEIQKLWGNKSQAGYNIMRMYIPVGESSWSQSLETAKLAKSLGVILFASPWSMPAEWKTNNNIAAVYTNSNGEKQIGHLKEEYYADYANYLNRYVQYLRENGVELDAISIQNEPDMDASYAGCIWTPAQIVNFLKNYGSLIDCKIIAPESVGITDNYSNALLADDVISEFEIYGGHQYGAFQTAFQKVQEKGKEAWMTEYLINWVSDEGASRDFKWSTDAFTFAKAVNKAMLNNMNAWVHYASKRYYAMMGDGTLGSIAGEMTKRGYILSHYSKYAKGTTRIETSLTDALKHLEGSAYLSTTGDSVIIMVINPSDEAYTLTVDLPFYTLSGKRIITTREVNMAESSVAISQENCRPEVGILPSSFTTFIFTKSSERPVSQMEGAIFNYNKIDDQQVTGNTFGQGYKLSGKSITFDHSNPLISANTNGNNGYLQLDDRYNSLVFHVKAISSTLSYTSANTTLYYMNAKGKVNSHNYGTIEFDQNGNFDWTLDISPDVLTDGCSGILGISNSNYSSVLSISLGDVCFKIGNEKMFKFSGTYNNDDSNLLDCLADENYTALDFTETDGLTDNTNWNSLSANKNCVFYVAEGVGNTNQNVIEGNRCARLSLGEEGNFYMPDSIMATTVSYTRTFSRYGLMILPFTATLPAEVKGYLLQPSSTGVYCSVIEDGIIPANTPVLIAASGTFTFNGAGNVYTPQALQIDNFYGTYISIDAPAGSYALNMVDNVAAFYKVAANDDVTIIPFSAYLSLGSAVSASSLPLIFDDGTTSAKQLISNTTNEGGESPVYDLMGRRIYNPEKGKVYIQNGKKLIF